MRLGCCVFRALAELRAVAAVHEAGGDVALGAPVEVGVLVVGDAVRARQGIDSDELPRLFTRFFRGTFAVREAIQGAGLGLAITKTIIEGHGGRLWAEPNEPHGAIFKFSIPSKKENG